MTLQELQQKRIKLAAEIRALAVTQSEWTATDKSNWDATCEEYDSTAAELDRAKVEANGQRPRNPRIGRDGGVVDGLDHSGNAARNRVIDLDLTIQGWCRNLNGQSLTSEHFDAANRYGQDPRAAGLEIALGLSGPVNGRDWHPGQVRNDLTSQTVSGGGGLAMNGFVQALEIGMKAYGPMLRTSELIVTADGRPIPWPTVDDTSNTGRQVGEGAENTVDTSLTFGVSMWNAYKFSSDIIKVSHELLRDSATNLAAAIGNVVGERLGRIVNARATTGSGASTLRGIVGSAPVGKTSSSTTSFAYDDLIDLQHSVDGAYRQNPAGNVGWMMNDLTAAYCRKLKDGEGRYLWQDSVQLGQPSMLLAFPVFINNAMTSSLAASEKPVIFGDLAKYKMRIVDGIRLRQLNERYAENDQVAFLAFMECDGALLKTSDAQSPVKCLQLAAA